VLVKMSEASAPEAAVISEAEVASNGPWPLRKNSLVAASVVAVVKVLVEWT